MKKFSLLVFGLIFILSSQTVAQDKVVVVSLFTNDTTLPVACTGALSAGGRWCDQGDGTLKDLTTKLIWLKDAGWGGSKPWRNSSTDCSSPNYTCYDDAHTRVGLLYHGASDADLSDGSSVGDWRLPNMKELINLVQGTEAIRSSADAIFY